MISMPSMSRPSDFARLRILLLGSDENRNDHSGLGRLQRAAERGLVAGMGDGRRERRQALRRSDQPLVLLVLAQLGDDGLLGHGAVLSHGRCVHERRAPRLTTSGTRPTSPGMPPGKLMISA